MTHQREEVFSGASGNYITSMLNCIIEKQFISRKNDFRTIFASSGSFDVLHH